MRTLGDSLRIFAPDVLGREFDIKHGSLNLRMPHQVLERRQGDAGPDHIRSEGVAEAVGIGGPHLAAQSMVSKQRAEARRRHG